MCEHNNAGGPYIRNINMIILAPIDADGMLARISTAMRIILRLRTCCDTVGLG